MVTQSQKYSMQMFGVLGFILGINQNIINENDHELVQFRHENRIHQIHEICWCICQPDDITKNSYSPYLVENAVFGISLARILI